MLPKGGKVWQKKILSCVNSLQTLYSLKKKNHNTEIKRLSIIQAYIQNNVVLRNQSEFLTKTLGFDLQVLLFCLIYQ